MGERQQLIAALRGDGGGVVTPSRDAFGMPVYPESAALADALRGLRTPTGRARTDDLRAQTLDTLPAKAAPLMTPGQAALMGVGMIPGVGDAVGVAADAYTLATDPGARTMGNALLAGAGLLPFVPSGLGMVKRVVEDAAAVDHASLKGAAKAAAVQGGRSANGTVAAGASGPDGALPQADGRTVRVIGDGPFGPTYEGSTWRDALADALRRRDGEIVGHVRHDAVGSIGVPWGASGTGESDGFGLSKIALFHPEVLGDLPKTVEGMKVVSQSPNRIRLSDGQHDAAVRLTWEGDPKPWLLTAFKKK